MSIRLSDHNITVTCPNGHQNMINIQDWEMDEPEVYQKSDSQRGNEICHRFHIDGVPCSGQNCNESISAEIEVWEYPVGMEESRAASDNVNGVDVDMAIKVEVG